MQQRCREPHIALVQMALQRGWSKRTILELWANLTFQCTRTILDIFATCNENAHLPLRPSKFRNLLAHQNNQDAHVLQLLPTLQPKLQPLLRTDRIRPSSTTCRNTQPPMEIWPPRHVVISGTSSSIFCMHFIDLTSTARRTDNRSVYHSLL